MSDTENNLKIVSLPRETYKAEPELTIKSIFDELGLQETYDGAINGKGTVCMTVALTEEDGQKLTDTGKVRVEPYYELAINI